MKLPFSETELLKDMTPETAHAEIIAQLLKSEYQPKYDKKSKKEFFVGWSKKRSDVPTIP